MRSSTRGVVFTALFAALLVTVSFFNINLPFSPVPVSLETLVVILAGAMLGAWYGFLSMFLVILLTGLGLPLFHGQGGLALLTGYTGGYVWLFPVSAWVTGYLLNKVKGRIAPSIPLYFLIFLLGDLIVYLTGVPWLAQYYHLSLAKAIIIGFVPFIPGDLIKVIMAVVIAVPVRRVFPVSRIIGRV